MSLKVETPQTDYRPRIIIWQITSDDPSRVLTTHECLLIIDSIARTSKPIVVLTGTRVLRREDLYEIVEYARALGLKIIIEAQPQELTGEVLTRYSRFGPKIFRVLLGGAVIEDMDTRYEQSKQFTVLEDSIKRLRDAGYEIHFGVSIAVADTNLRELAFEHDYAVRRSANGLFCHLWFKPGSKKNRKGGLTGLHEVIEAIARMKRFSPRNMYVSPQCVRYGIRQNEPPAEEGEQRQPAKIDSGWEHWCLAGKTFAYINAEGKIQLCVGLPHVCGDLRTNGYDFQEVWSSSRLFNILREQSFSCDETRKEVVRPRALERI